MAFSSIKYVRVSGNEEDGSVDSDTEHAPLFHLPHKGAENRWGHIADLDHYFQLVYAFWHVKGFLCFLMEEIFSLLKVVFVIFMATFLLTSVNYSELMELSPTRMRLEELLENYFRHHNASFVNSTAPHPAPHFGHDAYVNVDSDGHVDLWSVVSFSDFFEGRSNWVWYVYLVCAIFFLIHRVVRTTYRIREMWGVRGFYRDVLHIGPSELENYTWPQVVAALIEAHNVHRISMESDRLTSLDIHNRILRFKNFVIALISHKVLPIEFSIPCLGKRIYFTEQLKFLYEMILFWGPGSPFADSSNLKKNFHSMSPKMLAGTMERTILVYALVCFALLPLILIWNLFHAMSVFGETIQQKGGAFALRSWSPYARQKLRLYNEPDHQFRQRLAKAYDPATKYINSFLSPVVVVLARNIMFFCCAIFALLFLLSILEPTLLTNTHIPLILTFLGVVIHLCRTLSPGESDGADPENLLLDVISNTYEGPTRDWQGNAHTIGVRDSFGTLFPYRVGYLLEQLVGPIVCPLILYFSLRSRSQQIISFFQKFTVRVQGVGDICSFAQLDVRNRFSVKQLKKGDAPAKGGPDNNDDDDDDDNSGDEDDMTMMMGHGVEDEDESHDTANGKVKMSLINFSMSHPRWVPPSSSVHFMKDLRESAGEDALRECSYRSDPSHSNIADAESTLRSTFPTSGPSAPGAATSSGTLISPTNSMYPDLSFMQPKVAVNNGVSTAAHAYQSLILATSMLSEQPSEGAAEAPAEPRSVWSPNRQHDWRSPAGTAAAATAGTGMDSSYSLPRHPRTCEEQIANGLGHAAVYLQGHVARRAHERRHLKSAPYQQAMHAHHHQPQLQHGGELGEGFPLAGYTPPLPTYAQRPKSNEETDEQTLQQQQPQSEQLSQQQQDEQSL